MRRIVSAIATCAAALAACEGRLDPRANLLDPEGPSPVTISVEAAGPLTYRVVVDLHGLEADPFVKGVPFVLHRVLAAAACGGDGSIVPCGKPRVLAQRKAPFDAASFTLEDTLVALPGGARTLSYELVSGRKVWATGSSALPVDLDLDHDGAANDCNDLDPALGACGARQGCAANSGRCECLEQFTGPSCEACSARFGGEDCSECSPIATGPGCASCRDPRFTGDRCDACAPGFTGEGCATSQWAVWPMPHAAGTGNNPASYTVDGETVRDDVTKLVWQRTVGGYFGYSQAEAYCANLSLGGSSDWRLPSRIELLSLLDTTVQNGAGVDAAAFGTAELASWTSSRTGFGDASRWTGVWYALEENGAHVRCVR